MSSEPTTSQSTADVPELAQSAVLFRSEDVPAGTPEVGGHDFNGPSEIEDILKSYLHTGFQSTNVGLAIEQINQMIQWRLSDEPVKDDEDEETKDPEYRKNVRCTIFLSFTSNMISCGIREVIRYLCEHKMVDCIVTTGGAIEEDIMKCLKPHYMGDFALPGVELRKKGINRIGNLLVPNLTYCAFEDWFAPLLHKMHDEQEADGMIWSPSKMINRIGQEVNDPRSVLYWCWKNDIPVYCPAITDGSIGDMIYFHSYKRDGFIVDIAQDIRGINSKALKATKSGMVILGGGLVKHHVCNANLMRNGADYSVFVNTAHEFDGSDSGARPDEAISWGKIKIDAKPVKVYAEASIILPLLVSQTFKKHQASFDERLAAFNAQREAEAAKKAPAVAAAKPAAP